MAMPRQQDSRSKRTRSRGQSRPRGRTDGADHDIVEPSAAILSESLRAFSYSLPSAIADLIDNSISAAATRVWVNFCWDGQESVIVATDNGTGMSEDRLVAAMRPGSQSPLTARSPRDLGRFGLGMKTASFSQCRRLTVRTKTAGSQPSTRCWDLDHVAATDRWELLRTCDGSAEGHLERLDELPHGTAVVWQKLDRLVEGQRADNDRDQQHFLGRAEDVRRHLGMVFHRLLTSSRRLKILLNDRAITPWDPFLTDEMATQILPRTSLRLGNSRVEVQPYVLPHHSKLTRAKVELAAGPNGWNAHQGFFVYRNERLLLPGDWLGLGWNREEPYKLARIRVEVPTSLDQHWQIDVTKSRAIPPPALRHELRRIGERAREQARLVYSYRGARLTPQGNASQVFLWEPMARHSRTFYRISREHPLVKAALASPAGRSTVSALLRLIEETVPYPHITMTGTETPEALPGPFEGATESQVLDVMEQAYLSLLGSGYPPRDAIGRLSTIWPFEQFPALLQSLKERLRDV